ncbi:MAG: DnaJ domain-containing protein [Anaerolineae bacterium]|nr:DnaJ domain-containing protein [Anaerolineae bacterium]
MLISTKRRFAALPESSILTLTYTSPEASTVDYKDYYRILGVERAATDQEIRRAFRQLAREFHPDVNPGATAEERFKEINEAYTVLSDADKRKRYDQLNRSYRDWQGTRRSEFDWARWTQQAQQQRPPATQEAESNGVFSEFFNAVFGDSGRRNRTTNSAPPKPPIRGQDVETTLTISLEEACHGTTQTLGRGSRTFTAHIPPGVQTGTRIRFAAQGESGFAGGEPGDLFVTLTVGEHPVFERRGDDLVVEVDVPVVTAALGGDVRLPTLEGDIRLKIPPETQSGQMIRLRGRGMPQLRNPEVRGDLYARVMLKLPARLTEEEVDLFQQLAELRPEDSEG